MEEKINPLEQNQWEAGPNEDLKIPEGYIKDLRYEIIIFGRKKEFTFRCENYNPYDMYPNVNKSIGPTAWKFGGVIMDTSKKNPKGEIELKRLTYHPEIVLVNIPFMVIPAQEEPNPLNADS